MWLRQVWDMFKRRFTDRSEPVETGQNDREANAPITEDDEAIDETARGSRMKDVMEDASQNEVAEQRLDAALKWEMECEDSIWVLSQNRYPPDIHAFADYLREALPWGPFVLGFEKLYDHYLEHCVLSNRRPMTPRQLQNEWKKVGHVRRESTAVAPRRRCYFLQDDRTGAARVGKIPRARAVRR
jgi:hypothetical protein